MTEEDRATHPGSSRGVQSWAVMSGFLALAAIAIMNHEMWRDELEIWLVARDSTSLLDLFRNMATEGHPALWYVLNFLITRVTTDPLAMQMASLLIGTAAVGALVRFAPFRLHERVLLSLGYFSLYEFTTISRAYGLQTLLSFAFCALYCRRAAPAWQVFCLVLLAHTTLYGTMTAGLLGLLLLSDRRQLDEEERSGVGWIGAGTAILAAVAAFLHVLDQSLRVGPDQAGAHRPGYDAAWAAEAVATIGRALAPLPDPTSERFWNTHLFDLLPPVAATALGVGLTLTLLIIAGVVLAPRWRLLALFGMGAAAMLGITLFVWHGSMRHHGQVFCLFVVLAWLRLGQGGGAGSRRAAPARGVLAVLLMLQLVAGGMVWMRELRQPFSHARNVAQYLEGLPLDDPIIVGSFDYAAQPINAWRDGSIYYPESKRFGTFMRWGPERRMVPPGVALDEAVRLSGPERRPVVLVLSYALGSHAPGEVLHWGEHPIAHLASFEGAMVERENYHLYLFPADRR